MNGIKVFFRPRATIQNDCKLWARKIRETYKPDLVVFLAKSGFMFAEPMAKELGCIMVDISVSRPDNGMKDSIRKKTPWLPKWLLSIALSSSFGYKAHEEDSNREVVVGKALRELDMSKFHRILVVDDSIDTGWSMLRALDYLREAAPESTIKVASYCVIDLSESRVKTDFWRYKNTIVMTATSRFSPEYQSFIDDYTSWKGQMEHVG